MNDVIKHNIPVREDSRLEYSRGKDVRSYLRYQILLGRQVGATLSLVDCLESPRSLKWYKWKINEL